MDPCYEESYHAGITRNSSSLWPSILLRTGLPFQLVFQRRDESVHTDFGPRRNLSDAILNWEFDNGSVRGITKKIPLWISFRMLVLEIDLMDIFQGIFLGKQVRLLSRKILKLFVFLLAEIPRMFFISWNSSYINQNGTDYDSPQLPIFRSSA